jgi:hypothetical protein
MTESTFGGNLLSGVWIQAVDFVLAHLSGFSCLDYVFTFNLVNRKKLYKRTFSVICKDSSAISCITLQQKQVLFPSTSMDHILAAATTTTNSIHFLH